MLTKQKTTGRAVHKKVSEKFQRKHSSLKEPHEMLDKTKTLTIIARQNKAKRKSPKIN